MVFSFRKGRDFRSLLVQLVLIEVILGQNNKGYIKEAEKTETVTPVKATPKKATDKFFLDKKAGMIYCDNNEELYIKMLEMYYRQGLEYLPQLREHFAQRDWKNFQIVIHAVKGTSMTIGARYILKRAKDLETATKKGKEEILLAECEEFFDDYQAFLNNLVEVYHLEKNEM